MGLEDKVWHSRQWELRLRHIEEAIFGKQPPPQPSSPKSAEKRTVLLQKHCQEVNTRESVGMRFLARRCSGSPALRGYNGCNTLQLYFNSYLLGLAPPKKKKHDLQSRQGAPSFARHVSTHCRRRPSASEVLPFFSKRPAKPFLVGPFKASEKY